MFDYIKRIWKTDELRRKILFVIFGIVVFRLAAHIPLPWVNVNALDYLFKNSNSMLWVFSALTWWSMERFSIVLMWLAPYINASIIIQLMAVVIPSLERMQKDEWEQWRKKLNSYTRWLTFPLALLQSYWMIMILNMSANWRLIDVNNFKVIVPTMVSIAAWTIFLMWLWEIMTEKWIWNWTSMLIFAWIISSMPPIIWNILWLSSVDSTKILPFILFMGITVALLVAIVIFSESQRNIPITYALAWNRSSKWTLPIRLNQAWMIPIIFAIAIITLPSVVAHILQNSSNPTFKSIATTLLSFFDWSSWFYIIMYFLLVMWFSYFYVWITFKPDQIAENIQKRWWFITWMRPWSETAAYFQKISNNLNFWWWWFLAFVAVLPIIFTKFTDLSQSDLLITWSWLIIVVWVALDLIRQINAHLVMHDYDTIK